MDVLREASFLSEFGGLASQASQASQVPQNYDDGTNAGFEFSPIGNQVASPSGSDVASGIDLNTPPRQNSPRDSVAVTGMDLLDTPNTTANNVAGTLIPAPSPRRSTQSPETHRLQQALRNNATEQVLGYDYAGSTSSNEGGNTPSAFSAFGANNRSIAVETVNENSDGGDEWLEEGELAGNTAGDNVKVDSVPTASKADDSTDKVQVDLIQTGSGWFPRISGTSDEAGMAYDSSMAMGVASTSPHAGKNLVISTVDPGQADFAITVGNLGNASGTPLDGSHNNSFGEDVAGDGRIVDSAAKSAASRTHWSNRLGNRSSVKADDETESNASIRTPPNYDQSNPEVIGDLLSRPPKPLNHSPISSIKFNEQTVVTEYTQHGVASTTIGNLAGASNDGNSSSNNDSNPGGSSGGNGNPNGNPNPNPGNSGGNNDDSNQGRTSGGFDPQGSGPDPRDLSKIILDFGTRGGRLETWGIQGTIPVESLFQFAGFRDDRTHEWMIQCKRQLIRPEIVDRVAYRMRMLFQHNDWNRLRMIINGMPLIVRTRPNERMTADNSIVLNDDQESTQAMCRILMRHLAVARTL